MKKSNVITVGNFKALKEQTTAEQEWHGYLDVLSFNELITEATEVIAALKVRPLDKELTVRSKTIISQFSKRLKIDSPELATFLLSEQAQTNGLLSSYL